MGQDRRSRRRGRCALARALGAAGTRGRRLSAAGTGDSTARRSRVGVLAVPLGVDPAGGSEDGFERVPRDAPQRVRRTAIGCGSSNTSRSFDRAGYYGDASGDYPDNGARFTLLGRAALEAMRAEARPVDILHGHDWQAGPAILSLRMRYGARPAPGQRAAPCSPATTSPTTAGWPRERAWALDLPGVGGLARGHRPAARGDPACADIVNTVSPTYARESLTPELGAGLDDVLRGRGDGTSGIMNGIDPELGTPRRTARWRRPTPLTTPRARPPVARDLCTRLGLDPGGPHPRGHRPARSPEGLRPGRGGAHALLEQGARLASWAPATTASWQGSGRRPPSDPSGSSVARALRPGRGATHLRRRGPVPDAFAVRAVRPGPAHRDALWHGPRGAGHGRSRGLR